MSTLTTKLKNLKDYRSTVDPKVKDEIILEYAPLVRYIAQKIASRLPSNIELDDLMSCGVIGLMDAIEKFDPTRDNKFKTYAEFRTSSARRTGSPAPCARRPSRSSAPMPSSIRNWVGPPRMTRCASSSSATWRSSTT